MAQDNLEFGRRLLPHVVDDVARKDPQRVFATIADCGKPLSDPSIWHDISYRQMANAVDYMAYTLTRENAAHGIAASEAEPFPTLAYIGLNDVRYIIFLLAAIKAGCQALYISPRNTLEGQLNLFNKTACRAVWSPASHRALILSWQKQMPSLAIFTPPEIELDFLLNDASVQDAGRPFVYSKTFDEAAKDPAVILHTSGTTGLPKPIVVRQGMWAIFDRVQHPNPPLPPDFKSMPRTLWQAWQDLIKRQLAAMPPFHAAGLSCMTPLNIYLGVAPVFPPTDRPINSALIEDMLRYSGVDGTMIAPFMLEEMAKTEEGLNALRRLKCLIFGGGALSKHTGDLLVRNGICISNGISSTECIPYIMGFQEEPELWEYFIIHDSLMGATWRPVSLGDEERLYELVIKRDRKHPSFQAVFWTFPELEEWSTNDIYQRHPTRPNHWRYFGRLDDVLVLSNGEKLNPLDIEKAVMQHPAVIGSLVVGAGRFQPALLLEIKSESLRTKSKAELLDDIWPVVEAANKETVAHGRIARHMVMLALADGNEAKPFSRSPKGSIQRIMSGKLYEQEINALYGGDGADGAGGANGNGPAEVVPDLDISSAANLAQSISAMLAERVGVTVPLEPDTDLFAIGGVDSLQVMNMTRLLRLGLQAALKKEGEEKEDQEDEITIDQRDIYTNPTPLQLATFLLAEIRVDKNGNKEDKTIQEMQTLIDRFSANLGDVAAKEKALARPLPRRQGQTVLVTGTTGYLGCYLLDALLHTCPGVGRVVALNRDADGGRARQIASFAAHGLSAEGLDTRVQFLHADLSQPQLGLDEVSTYDALLADVDRIVHNAWPVHFHYNITSFAPSVAGVRQLAEFAAAAARQVPLLFISSISSVNGWNSKTSGPVPETVLPDLRLAFMGYGRSKLVASTVLDAASEALGVPVVQVRLGQVGGPRLLTPDAPALPGAAWNRTNLFPSIVASSVHLGMLPTTLGPMDTVDWIPVQDAAETILDMVGATEAGRKDVAGGHPSQYYHLVNPRTVPWGELTLAMQKYYAEEENKQLALVPLADWVARLEESSANEDTVSIAANPAVKLLDQLRGFATAAEYGVTAPQLAVTESVACSPTLRNLGAITGDVMVFWCKQWAFL